MKTNKLIVIGSGLGGLECAALLSQAGHEVLVLEREAQPGGCMQSYRRGAFRHDTGLHYVGGLAEGQPLHDAFQRLGLLCLPWQRLDADGFDRITIGADTYCFAEGYDRFAEVMTAYFPAHREALRSYVGLLQRTATTDINNTDMMDVSAYDYLLSLFHDPLVVNVLSGAAMKTELRRESLPLFTFAHGQSSYIQSSWRLRGDGSLLVQTLVDAIRQQGGRVLCGAEACELVVREGRVQAVRTTDGECYEADVVVSDVHPLLTYRMVQQGGVLKPLFLRRMAMLENTAGMFTASLVLKADVLPYFNHNKYVYDTPDIWGLADGTDRVRGVMVSCRVPADGSRYARQVDLLTPMPFVLCQPWADTRVGRRGDDYVAMKQRMADACIRLAERVVPGLGAMVAECHTSTPLTYRDYTCTPDGSAFGVRKDCRQPVLTMLSPKTPIPNLLLTGQSLMLPGIEGVTMTALQTVEAVKSLSSV